MSDGDALENNPPTLRSELAAIYEQGPGRALDLYETVRALIESTDTYAGALM